jgi:Thiamine pyrophosphate enzyme, C-terminal TPP binding domain
MLLTLCVIALAVMFRSSAMRFRCIFVMVGGFVVFVLSHWLPRFKFSMGSYQHPTGNFVPVVLRRIYRISSAPLAHPRIDRHPWTGRLAGKSINRPLERCFMVHSQSRNCCTLSSTCAGWCVFFHPDATFVFDTGLNTLWSGNWIRQSGSQRIIGSFNNASVGTAMAQANGIQALDRARQVIVLTGDAGFNMLMGEFMTAVHHELPIKVVIFNNSALGLITLEAESVGILPFREAIEFPNPDFAALARACGGHGFTVKHPGLLRPELNEAFALDGPAIIDCVVPADEMPDMPHIELDQIGNYAVAKIKEAIHAVTGG